MKKDQIPIVIGITGHRIIPKSDESAIYASVKRTLGFIREQCPHSELVLLDSLAEGGDLLCAKAANELQIPLIAALPFEKDLYEKVFSDDALLHFRSLCEYASDCFVAPPTESIPCANFKEYGYRQASIYVATHAHVLLALWDGETESDLKNGCGTAFAVDVALHGLAVSNDRTVIDGCGAVIQIVTPRINPTNDPAGTVKEWMNRRSFEELLSRTDEFNRLADSVDASEADPILPEEDSSDPILDRMAKIHAKAETLSNHFAKRYRTVLMLLAAASTVLTLSFLLYDEAELYWMILICGAMLLFAFFLRRIAARTASHRRYIEYRALEESVRAQSYLRYAGSSQEAFSLLSWSQRQETAWIYTALAVIGIGDLPSKKHTILACWIRDQRSYHQQAEQRTKKRIRFSEGVVRTALWVSILLYCGTVAFEVLFKTGTIWMIDAVLYRTILKILLGSISAATLFISGYYGKQSLSRKWSDHRKMERFFQRMEERCVREGQTEELLQLLAREELSENGNWSSYQRDNTPDFSL